MASIDQIEIIGRAKGDNGDTYYIYVDKEHPKLKRIITKAELQDKIQNEFSLAIKLAKVSWESMKR